jgi:hypothetical protein
MLIQFGEDPDDGLLQSMGGAEEVVVQGGPFQVAPQRVDGVEFGAVFGQPEDEDVVFMLGEQIERCPGQVVGGVVQDEDDEPVAFGGQQVLEKGVEVDGVLLGIEEVVDLAGAVVQCTVDAQFAVGAGRRDLRPLAPEGPGLGQRGVEVNLRFVEEEEIEIVPPVERVFFRKASSAFFSSYSWGSCKCPMTCRGRR